MSKDIVTKTNTLIQASYSLSANEIKLIGLAIVDSRESGLGLNADSSLTISAANFAKRFNIQEHTAYEVLKTASKSLFDRQATYEDIHPETGKVRKNLTRWVSSISYVEGAGLIQLTFAPQVIPMITYIDGRVEGYTSYLLDEISGLKSAYAIRLFELLMQWKTTQQTPPITVDKFRELVGVTATEYPLMSDFKKRVLDLAVKQINENTDFIVTYDQKKTGVKVTGFIFKFKEKKPVIEHKEPKPSKGSKSKNPFKGVEDMAAFLAKHKQGVESFDETHKRLLKEAEDGTFTLSATD